MDRLSGDFNRGYTKAIQDITRIFEYIDGDLTYHKKRVNSKLAKSLLQAILENREYIRESYKGFIRWNSKKNNFEWFSGDVL